MNTYESRRRTKILAYLLIVLLALPPGFLPTAMAANKRSNALTCDALMETFRNPQFSSAASFYDDVENNRITADTVDLGAHDGARRLLTVLRGVATAAIGTAMATNVTNEDCVDLVEYAYDEAGSRTTRRTNHTTGHAAHGDDRL